MPTSGEPTDASRIINLGSITYGTSRLGQAVQQRTTAKHAAFSHQLRNTIPLHDHHPEPANSLAGCPELQLEWGRGSLALQLPLQPMLSATRKGDLDLQVQLARLSLEWAPSDSRPQSLRATIIRKPAAHPAVKSAAHAAALLILHVLMPDLMGAWMHTLTVPCSLAAGAALAMRMLPRGLAHQLGDATSKAGSFLLEDDDKAGRASSSSSSSKGRRSSLMLAVSRATAVIGLFLYQQLQEASGAAALLVSGNAAWSVLHPYSHYLGQCMVALLAVAAEYNQLSRQAAAGALQPGAQLEEAFRRQHKRAARRVSHLLRDLPRQPPLKPAADALSRLSIAAGLAVGGVPLTGAPAAVAPAAGSSAQRKLLLSASFRVAGGGRGAAVQQQAAAGPSEALPAASLVAPQPDALAASGPEVAADVTAAVVAAADASQPAAAAAAAGGGAIEQAPISKPSGYSSSMARAKPPALIDLHADCTTTSSTSSSITQQLPPGPSMDTAAAAAAGTTPQQAAALPRPPHAMPSPPPTPPQRQQQATAAAAIHPQPTKRVSFKQADGSIVYPATDSNQQQASPPAAAAALSSHAPAATAAAAAAVTTPLHPTSNTIKLQHWSLTLHLLQQLLGHLKLTLLYLQQQLGYHSTASTTRSSLQQQPAATAPLPLYGQGDHQEHQLQQQRSSSILDHLALTARALYLLLVFLPFLSLGTPLLLLSLKCASLAASRQQQRSSSSAQEQTAWLDIASSLRTAAWRLLLFGCRQAGAAFIKWAQWASTRGDLFPQDFCDTLSALHDAAPAHSFAHSRAQVEAAFGAPLHSLFLTFDPAPLASGSIAQVHRATLMQGGQLVQVVVKVRHPGVARQISHDFRLLKPLAAWAGRARALRGLSLKESVAQFSSTMTAQTDLRVEAAHLAAFGANFARVSAQVGIPKVVAGMVSEAVLVETFEPGRSVSHYMRQPSALNTRVVALGVDTYLKMLLRDNLVHTDLHPGNILVQASSDVDTSTSSSTSSASSSCKIVLLDFGLVEQLTPAVRHHFISFINHICGGNGDAAARHLLQWGSQQGCARPWEFIKDMRALFLERCDVHAPGGIDMDAVLKAVLALARKHEVGIDSCYASLVIAVCVIVGFATSLDPRVNLVDAATPCLLMHSLTGRVMGRMYS